MFCELLRVLDNGFLSNFPNVTPGSLGYDASSLDVMLISWLVPVFGLRQRFPFYSLAHSNTHSLSLSPSPSPPSLQIVLSEDPDPKVSCEIEKSISVCMQGHYAPFSYHATSHPIATGLDASHALQPLFPPFAASMFSCLLVPLDICLRYYSLLHSDLHQNYIFFP